MVDPLFSVRNNFYLGAYNFVVQEASELEGLPYAAAIERDTYLYRAYIALGSHQVRRDGGKGCSAWAHASSIQFSDFSSVFQFVHSWS